MTPKFEQCVAKWSEPASELKTGGRFSSLIYDVIHPKTSGSTFKSMYLAYTSNDNFFPVTSV